MRQHGLPKFRVNLNYMPHHVADTSTNQQQSLLCCCTSSMEQAADGAETAANDGLVSSWSENISDWFRLRAPGYRLTLWCALGLLVGDAIQASVTANVQNDINMQMTLCHSVFKMKILGPRNSMQSEGPYHWIGEPHHSITTPLQLDQEAL